jgi:phosphatidate cytidylyltransferase
MRRTVTNLNARIRAWWVMVAVFAGALMLGHGAVCVLFALMSFLALRELLTLTPTRPGDHHTLFWAFFVYVPLQYYLIYIRWEGFFMVFLPVYGFLFLAIRSTLTGDFTRYMERTAKVTWGVMVCVYLLSHAPALLMLDVKGQRDNWKLLVFLVMVVQMSDVLQYVWGKLLGRHKIAPHISPSKTWEGFIGGGVSAALLGMALWRFTPCRPLGALAIAAVIVVVGFFGGIVMSAVKRDAGVKDFGHLIEGHGGMLDRVDSLTFAAPVFFHVIRWWFTGPNAVHGWG